MIELPREALLTDLENATNDGHLLVVGEPGAGKSWLLRSFVDRREEHGDGPIFLKAEDYIVGSLQELLDKIGADDFFAALRNFPGNRKFLVIDSLDSLRAEASQRAFRDLIRIAQEEVPEVVVVASIRTFDMQQSTELQRLFPSKPKSTLGGIPGVSAHHLIVPLFSEAEVDSATKENKTLSAVLLGASLQVKTLLRNAFNLWLVTHLIDAGAAVDWLSAVQSEVQLLDGYWKIRVESRNDSADRTVLLIGLTNRMVKTESMSLAFRDVADLSTQSLPSLLSEEILFQSETGRLSYSHNIFFDFAISKLLIDEKTVLQFVLAAPARSIFYRPSISYFMARLWFRDRDLFWETVERFFERRTNTPAVIAITAARSIFELARTNDDVAPMFGMPPDVRVRAIAFLLRAILAMNGLESSKRFLWLVFFTQSLTCVDKTFLNESVATIDAALRGASSAEEIRVLTLAAIALLRWIWGKAEVEPNISDGRSLADFAAARLLPIAAKNYATAPSEAKALLTEVISRFNNPRSSANEAFRIASNLDAVIESDPETASLIYNAILGHEETSRDETQLGGAILPMRSFRSQDFELAYHLLGTKFGELAVREPFVAARTVGHSVTAQVRRKEGDTVKSLRAYEWSFEFLGKRIRFNSDRSEIWDHSHKDYTAIQLVDRLLFSLKAHLGSGILSRDEARAVLCELGQANEFAVTWKRILTYASHTSEFLAIIPDLLRIPELLAAPETTEAAGAAITKAYAEGMFTPDEFAAIQNTILDIPNLPLATIFRDPLYVRDSLLAHIPSDKRRREAIEALAARNSQSGPIYPTGFFQTGPGIEGPEREDSWLKRQGIETDRTDNRALLDATKVLKSFETQFLNQTQTPTKEDAEGVKEKLWTAYQLIHANPTADERVVTDVLTTAAAVSKNVLRNKELTMDADVVKKCKTIIVEAAVYPLPLPVKDADENFDRPAWSPTPKIEAAQGVMNYLGNWGGDDRMESLAVTLSTDANPAVRLQITMCLTYLYENNRDLFWRIADERLSAEKAIGVLDSLAHAVTHPYIAKRERKRVIDWQTSLLRRELPSGRIDDVLKTMAHSLTDLYVFFGDVYANEAINIFEREPGRYATELAQVVLSSTVYISDGIESNDQAKWEARDRARKVWTRMLGCADIIIAEYFSTPKPVSADELERAQEVLREALRIIDHAVFQLYLLFRVNEHLVRENLPSLDDTQRRQLFRELDSIWKLLLGPIGPNHKGLLPAQTTHHLVELFRTTVSYDPARVLQLAADLFKGFNMGYQSDQMAIAEVVRFAEIILADHKEILKDPENAENLAFILDQFVEFGWPQATQVLMKLDGAVR